MTGFSTEIGGVMLMILSVPLIYWLIGLRLSWRSTLVCVLLTYAAAILASQHADELARSELLNGGIIQTANATQSSALAFGLLLVSALLALTVVFQLMWGPGRKADNEGGSRLLRSLVTAIAGWGLAALLMLSFIGFSSGVPVWGIAAGMDGGLVRAAEITARAVMSLVTPWLASGLPLFMGG